MTTLEKKHITYAGISDCLHMPGTVHVRIHRLNGYFVPFIFHTAPGSAPVGQGPIAEEGAMVASMDLNALIDGLKETFGDIEIFVQNTETPAAVLH